MQVCYLDLPRQFQEDDLLREIKKALSSGRFILGPEVEEFEKEFAQMCGSRFTIGVNSGTDALFLCLKAVGIGAGAEVLTAPNSFLATAGAIIAAGAKPVFVDVGPDYNMAVEKIEPAITAKTKAIIPVHLTGHMADMPEIMTIARKQGLFVFEDAAQSVMASLNGKKAGTYGDAGCFSLHPLKNLNVAGDGGIVTTDSEELYQKIKLLRNHGLKNRDEIDFFGYNSRLDTLQAVIASYNLKRLPAITARRIANATLYDRALADLREFVLIPPRDPHRYQVFHTYVIQVQDRERLIAYLSERGVETKIHYPIPIHLQKPCQALGYRKGDFPVCERQSEKILSLPVHQHLEPEHLYYVSEQMHTFYGNH